METAMTKKDRSTVYRFCPCPLYDIEALESWLGEMAQNGLQLCKDGFWGDLVQFERTNPRVIRYRLDAAPLRHSIFDDTPSPTEEELEIAAAAGWQYWGRRSYFYIYCTEEPRALELNTDPRVQAMSLDLLRKETRRTLSFRVFILLLQGWQLMGMPLLTMIELGPVLGTLTLVSLLWYILSSLLDLLQLRRLQKKLRGGTPLDHQKDWRKARRANRTHFVLDAIAVVWLLLLLYAALDDTSFGRQRTALEDYGEPLPVYTLADYCPAGLHTTESLGFGKYNTLARKSSLLAPDFIDLWESGSIITPDGERLQGFLIVKYYELPNEAMAQQVARELEWLDRTDRTVKYQPLTLPEQLDADYAVAYTEVFPTVIIRQGCRVARYQLSVSRINEKGEQVGTIPVNEWAQWAAAGLKN